MIYLQFCQHWVRTAPKVWNDSWPAQPRNREASALKNFQRKLFEKKKMGFLGIITSVPSMNDKMTLKLPREPSILQMKRECAGCMVPVCILCCPLIFDEWDCLHGFCLISKPVGQALMHWSKISSHAAQHKENNPWYRNCYQ